MEAQGKGVAPSPPLPSPPLPSLVEMYEKRAFRLSWTSVSQEKKKVLENIQRFQTKECIHIYIHTYTQQKFQTKECIHIYIYTYIYTTKVSNKRVYTYIHIHNKGFVSY